MTKPIAFYPELARELGDIASAIYYQQLYFWSDKGGRDDGFIYKSKREIEEETTLSREQQDRIRPRLEEKGWLEVKKMMANGKPTLHYRPLVAIKVAFGSIGGKDTNGKAGKTPIHKRERHLSITESTTESTAEKKKGEAPEWTEISEVIDLFKAVNPSWEQLFKNRTERAAMGRLIAKWGRPKMEEVIAFLPKSNGKAYAPTITSPWELEKKLGALKAFFDKERSKGREKKIDLGVVKV